MAETGVDAACVEVLGPVRVATPGGAIVDVPGTNGKALIVSLVLAKGSVVSVGSLVDDIWQDDPPRNARAALQTLVSRVRAVAGDELIESVAGGYRLGTDAVDLWSPDAERRGEPGADLGSTELAARLRETADGVRTRALEVRVTDALSSGATRDAAAAARALVDAGPYNERAQLLLMKALAADGRRGEALRVFAEYRTRLDDELGARPGPELVACNAALLRVDTPAAAVPSDATSAATSAAGSATTTGEFPEDPAGPPRSGVRASDPSSAPGNPVAHAGAESRAESGPWAASAGEPIATPTAPKHVAIGLRAAPNQLIGRDADVAALEELMRTSRLTTILGPGGLGKTRLAQELAGRAAQATPGVVVVELAGIREAEDVPLAVAATLGIGEVGSARVSLRDPIMLLEVRTRIRTALAERETLLVLDNCEHVIEGAAQLVDQVLSEVPSVRVLATSRAPLQLGAESVYPLGSLAATPTGRAGRDAGVARPTTAEAYGPAVALFVERARAARPGAALPLDAVARLCEHLDGLPLAIELAAARIRSMSVDEIERRLGNRFALLRGGDRSAPERHRTLIAVIDWSWNLLAESERRMLRRLSRFPDGFSAEAAVAVAGAGAGPRVGGGAGPDSAAGLDEDARLQASDDLDALVTQSLVSVAERHTGLRYRMLETVREFGDMALVDAGEDALVAAAQAQWARGFTLDVLAALPTTRQTEAVLALEVEHDNLVAVLRAASDAEDAETIVPIFAALLFHWLVRNQFREAMSFAPSVAAVVAKAELPADAPDASAVTLIFATIMGIAGSRAARSGSHRGAGGGGSTSGGDGGMASGLGSRAASDERRGAASGLRSGPASDERRGTDSGLGSRAASDQRRGVDSGLGSRAASDERRGTGSGAASGLGRGAAAGGHQGADATSERTRDRRGPQAELPPEFEAMRNLPAGDLLRAGIRAGVRLRRLVRSGTVSPWLTEGAEMMIAGAHSPHTVLAQLARLRASSDEMISLMAHLFSGVLTENSGDLERAIDFARQAWQTSDRLRLDWIAGQAAQSLANLTSQDNRPEESLVWAARSREHLTVIGAIEEINQSDWTAGINKLKLGRRDGVAAAFDRFVSDESASQQDGFDVFDVRAIGWAGLAEIAAVDGRPGEAVELYRRAVSVYGARPGTSATGAWYLISGAGAVAASVYLDHIDDGALAIWRDLRVGARVELRQRGGPEFVDRPVLATAALGLALGLLAFPQATDARRTVAADLIALADRMHSRQDQPMLVRERAFAFAESVLGASAVAAARVRAAEPTDLAACTERVDELLRATRL